jgi:hypothetical protein
VKIRPSKDIFSSLKNLLLILLLLLPAVAWRGQIFGIYTNGTASQNPEMSLTLSDCKPYFEQASEVKKINNQQFEIYNSANAIIGYALAYKGEQGYGGRVPVYVLTDADNIIKGIVLGQHYESRDYMKNIVQKGLLLAWNGKTTDEALTVDVDAKTGATITSQAIISGVKSAVSGSVVKAEFQFFSGENIASLALLFLLTLAYFSPKKLMKYRTVLQVLSIAIYGFWLTHFLSLSQIIAWLSTGINVKVQLFLAILFCLSILLPILFGKSFYCSWVCPFGASQELCGKITKNKYALNPTTIKIVRYTRDIFFFSIMALLWLGFFLDLNLFEPFSAFSIIQTSYFTLGLAGFFLIVSVFVPKAWCKYFCPTGYILEWIRKEKQI